MWPLVTCAFVALGVSFGTLAYVVTRPWRDRKLVRAFETLEEEFDDLRTYCNSQLGRISRLKRSIMSGEVPLPGETEKGSSETGADGSPGLTTRQQQINEQILARRKRV